MADLLRALLAQGLGTIALGLAVASVGLLALLAWVFHHDGGRVVVVDRSRPHRCAYDDCGQTVVPTHCTPEQQAGREGR